MKKVLDLYSGLGGFSEAFARSPSWEVIRIENNPLLAEVPHTIPADIFDLDPRDYRDVDVILASPPCTEFSNAYGAPQAIAWRQGIRGDDYKPNMDLIKEAVRWNGIIRPRFFLMENVNGSQRHFRKLRQYPIIKHGPFIFYGKFPLFDMPKDWVHTKAENDVWSNDPLRANKKGKLPLELSRAILETVEGTQTLERWI